MNTVECVERKLRELEEFSDNVIVICQSEDAPPVIRVSGSLYAAPLLLEITQDWVNQKIAEGLIAQIQQGG